ncbi:TBCC domain-containing protein 1 isoform 2-T4 [Menidia menidia]
MEEDRVSVWPRMEPFLLGALQVAPSPKLSLHYLRKMAGYVRTRDGCFPLLGWPQWRHIACGKLQLPEELAWLYLETFDLLGGRTPGERLEWAECLSQCSTKPELDLQRSKLSVDTLQFLLFLYIQQLNRVSLRTSLIGEEWPGQRARSPSEAKASSQNKNWDDQAHLSFVQSHLAEILELLVEPDQLSQSGQAQRDCQVSLEAVRSLGLLLEGCGGPGRGVQPVHRLLTRALASPSGFCPQSRSFPLQPLLCCLQRCLTLNPFGMTACLRSGKKLAWAQQVEGAMKRAKIARNTHTAPPGSRMVLMSQVFKQTLAKTSEKLTGANIKIHRCSDAFIYLLSPLRSVSVDKCRDTTVVLGPVETSVHVHGCQNLRLVCVAGRVAVGGSSRCTVHALTPTRPLLLPGNAGVTLAPFHTFYPALEDHMAAAGLAVVPNLWDQPLGLGADGLPTGPAHNELATDSDPNGLATGPNRLATGPAPDGLATGPVTIGHAPYGLATGSAPNGLSTGSTPNRLATGPTSNGLATGPNRLATGPAPNRLATGSTPNRLTTGSTPDGLATGDAPNWLATGPVPIGHAHNRIATGPAHNRLDTGHAHNELATRPAPDGLATGSAPNKLTTGPFPTGPAPNGLATGPTPDWLPTGSAPTGPAPDWLPTGPAPVPPGCRLLPPAQLHALAVPFHMEGDTCEVPGGLPPPYQAALQEKQQRIQSWQRTVMEARLSPQQKLQFQELVELKFHEWLVATGLRQELDSLIPPPQNQNPPGGPGGEGGPSRAGQQSPMAC